MPDDANPSCRIVLCTCPDSDTARRIGAGLVEGRMAACVNVVAGIRSIYRWRNAVHDEAEVLMIIKTTQARYSELERWIGENHPYDVPEIIAVPVTGGSEAYLGWVSGETG